MREFHNIEGTRLSDLTNHVRFPNAFDKLFWADSFEVPSNVRDNYGVQMAGFLTAPLTGDYQFYLCSDDQGALFLSSDENSANKRLIASEPEWNPSREWVGTSRRPNRANISPAIRLEGGKKYYIEALMKEAGGGDNLAVAWRKQGDPEPKNGDPPISGAYLSPLPLMVAAVNPPMPPGQVDVEMLVSARLVWPPSATPDLLGYLVSRSVDGREWEDVALVEEKSYGDEEVTAGHDYRYRVAAVNRAGGVGPPSAATGGVALTMLVRQVEDYNYGGGKYPGFLRCPDGVEAPSSTALDSKYGYYYQFSDYWVPANPYRPDNMVVVDADPDPARTRWIIAWTSTGDWWRYTFDVPNDGWVKVALRAATPGVANIQVFWDEVRVGTIICNTGDWGRWDDFPANESFWSTAGRHTLRLQIGDAASNLDLFGIEFAAKPPRRTIFQDGFEAYADAEAVRNRGGWTIVNGSGRSAVAWSLQNTRAESRIGLFAGMTGNYFICDSGGDARARVDESIISPMIDCRLYTKVHLRFVQNLKISRESDSQQNCDVDIDVLDEATSQWSNRWTTVLHREKKDGSASFGETVSIGPWADGRRIRLRWRFHESNWAYWWAVDDIQLSGERAESLTPPTITSILVNSGSATTTNREVFLTSVVQGNPTYFIASEREDFADARWEPYTGASRFVLSPASGTKTVFLKTRNELGASGTESAKITLTPPDAPLSVTRSFRPPTVFPPGSVEIVLDIAQSPSGLVSGLELKEVLPMGWLFDSVVNDPRPSSSPLTGKTGTLLFRWDGPVTVPFTFVYRVKFAMPATGEGMVSGQISYLSGNVTRTLSSSGAETLLEKRSSNKTYHRVLYHAEVLDPSEWDWVARAGFTVVHSYGDNVPTLRQMLDEAHKRGIKMIAGAGFPQGVSWLTAQVNASVAGAPTELWPHVVHHFSHPNSKLILYGKGAPGLAEGLEISLSDPARDTLGKLATYLNTLFPGLTFAVLPGKVNMPVAHLATEWYGNAAQGPVTIYGSEINEAAYRQYVDAVKDHPALFCFAPFDDTDLLHFSPTYERYIREKLRSWAPKVSVYFLVSALGLNGGTFLHDHKIAPEAFDGLILYQYPHDWENAGVYFEVDSIRYLLADWWSLHARNGPKDILFLGAAFSQKNSPWTPPPKDAMALQWDAALRSGVPLAGFGYYGWGGGDQAIGNDVGLQREIAALNRQISSNYFQVTIEQSQRRLTNTASSVEFQAVVRGGTNPLVFQWNFGDGDTGWGESISHRYVGSGVYEVTLRALSADRLSAVKTARVYVLDEQSPVLQRYFDDGSTPGFATQGGRWEVLQGSFRQSDASAGEARAWINAGTLSQYALETDLRITGDRNRLWLIYSGAGTGSQYRLEIEPLQQAVYEKEGLTSRLRLFTDTGVVHTYLPMRRDRFYQVRLDVLADAVLASVDSTLLLEAATGGASCDGVVGFGGDGAAGQFDNLRVLPLTSLRIQPSVSQPSAQSQPALLAFAAGRLGGHEPIRYLWDFGDGLTSTEPAPEHAYGTSGAYHTILKVTDAAGSTVQQTLDVLAGAQVFYREAEDYDWTDGASPGYPTQAASSQRYGVGQNGRRGVDFRQAVRGQGDQSGWRDPGEGSIESGASDTGINLGWSSPGDWWNYTFKFPATGLAKIRGSFAAAQPFKCRLFWRDRFLCDLAVPGNGWQNYSFVESPVVPVDGEPGWFRFEVLDGAAGASLNFARFEVAFVSATDSDNDGIADFADLDNDNDGYMDADETTDGQSNPFDPASRPKDSDGDHLSDTNDLDDDNDSFPDALDPYPLIHVRNVNSTPTLTAIPDQTVTEGEVLDLNLGNPSLGTSPGLLREVFNGITGSTIADLTGSSKFPNRPDRSLSLTDFFETPKDSGDNFGQRLRGFLVAPQTGDYTFWIASDDASVLYLSTDEWSDHARLIASVNAWTDYRQWTIEPNQKSAPVHLEAGKRYYVEALMKEGEGGDNLSVRWQLPNGAFETPIPGSRLLAWVKDPPMVIANDPDLPGQQLTFSLGPDVPAGSAIDPTAGRLTWTPDKSQAGKTHPFTVRVTDDGNPPLSSETTFNVIVTKRINAAPVLAAIPDQILMEGQSLDLNLTSVGRSHGLLREVFTGINGNSVADLRGASKYPNRPDDVGVLTNAFETPIDVAENYGQRLRGFVVAPQTGNYTFWIASDDASALYLSRDENAANKRLIAGVNGWTEYRQWTLEANQKSASIRLEEGRRYYVEALMKEGCCDDHLSVRWQLPNGRFETPIPASRLLVWEKDPVPVVFATDPDLPLQQLTYGLGPGSPTGSAIDPVTSRLTWTPLKTQGPGTYTFNVVVTDNGDPSLSDTKSFKVVVQEGFYRMGLNFGANEANSSLVPTDFAGVSSVGQASWNNLIGQSGSRSGLSVSSNGTSVATATTVRWSATSTWASTGRGEENNRFTGADRILMTGYLDTGDATTTSVTLSNLPPQLTSVGYDVYVYLLGGVPNKGGGYRILDANSRAVLKNYVLAQCNANPTSYVQVPTNLVAGQRGTGNYIVFSGLTATNITIEATTAGGRGFGITPRAPLNAVQLVALRGSPNQAPVLTVIGSKAIDEGATLEFTVAGSDPNDQPANTVSLSATGLPTGATFNSATGAFAWTPGEDQQGTHNVVFTVTDDGKLPLSAGETVTITVREVNVAPVLAALADKTVESGQELAFTIAATDTDLPANSLAYALEFGSPQGAAIDPASGKFTWTPTAAQAGTTNQIAIRVTDDGVPPFSDTKSFTVVVAPQVSAPVQLNASLLSNGDVKLTWTATPGRTYVLQRSADLTEWQDLVTLDATGDSLEHIDVAAPDAPMRFYRVVQR